MSIYFKENRIWFFNWNTRTYQFQKDSAKNAMLNSFCSIFSQASLNMDSYWKLRKNTKIFVYLQQRWIRYFVCMSFSIIFLMLNRKLNDMSNLTSFHIFSCNSSIYRLLGFPTLLGTLRMQCLFDKPILCRNGDTSLVVVWSPSWAENYPHYGCECCRTASKLVKKQNTKHVWILAHPHQSYSNAASSALQLQCGQG